MNPDVSAFPKSVRKHLHRPVKLKIQTKAGYRVSTVEELKRPGHFCIWERNHGLQLFELAFILPGHSRPSSILIQKVDNVVRAPQPAEHVWNWNGNLEKPTVNPQIDSSDLNKQWKGYLINGQFVRT